MQASDFPVSLTIDEVGTLMFKQVEGLDTATAATTFRLPGGQGGTQIILKQHVTGLDENLKAFFAQPNSTPINMTLKADRPVVSSAKAWILSGVLMTDIKQGKEGIEELTLSYAYMVEAPVSEE